MARALCAARSAERRPRRPRGGRGARARGPGANPPPRLRPMRRRRRRPTAIGALRAEGFGFRRPIHRRRSARGARRRRAARPRRIRRGIRRARRRTTSSSRGSVGVTSGGSVCAQGVPPTFAKFRNVRLQQCRARLPVIGDLRLAVGLGAPRTLRGACAGDRIALQGVRALGGSSTGHPPYAHRGGLGFSRSRVRVGSRPPCSSAVLSMRTW